MPEGQWFANPNLDVTTINDFTPGLWVSSGTGFAFSPLAPLGSASFCFRCYAVPGVGLVPFPLNLGESSAKTFTAGTNGGSLILNDIQTYPLVAPFTTGDLLATSWTKISNATSTNSIFLDIDTAAPLVGAPPSITWNTINQYTHNYTTATSATVASGYPNLARGFWNTVQPTVGVFTWDQTYSTATQWVTVPSATTGASSSNTNGALFAAASSEVKVAYLNGRMTFMVPSNTAKSPFGALDTFFTSDIQATTNITGNEYFFPENAAPVGAWGSVSVGEFFFVYQNGTGVIVYGDIQNPSSAVNLPGVVGTGHCIGPAASTPIGLIYPTDNQGVYCWNGGNTAQKISYQIPDQCVAGMWPGWLAETPMERTDTQLTQNVVTQNGLTNTSNKTWGNWVFFSNNWVYDTQNQSWWLCEDPNLLLYQVYGVSGSDDSYFFGSTGTFSAATGTIHGDIGAWWAGIGAQTYTWVSNPIPKTVGSLTSLMAVEIVASNMTPYEATVTVTPTVPPGQAVANTLNQNPTQPAYFVIPPYAVAWRQSQPLGYTDYNIMIRVDAVQTWSPSFLHPAAYPAPTIHEITVGTTTTRTSLGR
jgi:hypothetical protein